MVPRLRGDCEHRRPEPALPASRCTRQRGDGTQAACAPQSGFSAGDVDGGGEDDERTDPGPVVDRLGESQIGEPTVNGSLENSKVIASEASITV